MLREIRANLFLSKVVQTPWWLTDTGSFSSELKRNGTTIDLLCKVRKLWKKSDMCIPVCVFSSVCLYMHGSIKTQRWKAFACLLFSICCRRQSVNLLQFMFANWPMKQFCLFFLFSTVWLFLYSKELPCLFAKQL